MIIYYQNKMREAFIGPEWRWQAKWVLEIKHACADSCVGAKTGMHAIIQCEMSRRARERKLRSTWLLSLWTHHDVTESSHHWSWGRLGFLDWRMSGTGEAAEGLSRGLLFVMLLPLFRMLFIS